MVLVTVNMQIYHCCRYRATGFIIEIFLDAHPSLFAHALGFYKDTYIVYCIPAELRHALLLPIPHGDKIYFFRHVDTGSLCKEQERLLGQLKTPPTTKFPFVTFRLKG